VEITDAWDVPAGFLPEDSAVCGKFSRFIIIPGYEEYQWNFGSTDSSVEFTTAGEYVVIVKDLHGCEGSDTIVYESLCEEALIMPNAFTPNGDGLNDIFKPVLLDDLTDFEFKVYNRWGKVIFFSANPDDGWDGKELEIPKGIEQYVWTVRYKNPLAKTGRSKEVLPCFDKEIFIFDTEPVI
jgi:gliding motility-associated-like protein